MKPSGSRLLARSEASPTTGGFSGCSSGHSPSTSRPVPQSARGSPASSASSPRRRGAVISLPRWETDVNSVSSMVTRAA
ncbi:hypothetical protein ACFZBP_18835 [Streptomyces sp. NPDC008086]|uniref:hypothetical protein n=1 Tax=Streptomyces sp. NPDC008086 TaxID=3364807 RepID=UPI0036E65710